MIAVPDAALLPSTPRPVRRENSEMISARSHVGTSGTPGRPIPIISQCPVTESFPAEASAIRPYAPSDVREETAEDAETAETSRRSFEKISLRPLRSPRFLLDRWGRGVLAIRPGSGASGCAAGSCLAILPTVLLPDRHMSKHPAARRSDAVHDDDDGAGERRLRGRHAAYWCESS